VTLTEEDLLDLSNLMGYLESKRNRALARIRNLRQRAAQRGASVERQINIENTEGVRDDMARWAGLVRKVLRGLRNEHDG
jgi:hypothetical protein